MLDEKSVAQWFRVSKFRRVSYSPMCFLCSCLSVRLDPHQCALLLCCGFSAEAYYSVNVFN